MPLYEVTAPDGKILEVEGPEGATDEQIISYAQKMYRPKEIKADTGFTGAFGAGKERLKGDIAALAGRTGLMDVEEAERYKAEKDILAEKMFKPTTAGWTESPFQKFKETVGGSLPYMAAPLAAGVAAATLPVSAPIAGAIGAGGAGLASLAQFTGSNLSRQMQEDPKLRLAETNLGAAGAAALPQAALDVVSMRMIPGIGKIFGAAGKPITPEIARKIAEEGIAKTALSYGVSGAKLANIEGATEAGQQFFERLQAGLNLTDEQARNEYFDNYIGGAALGLGLSPVGTYIERGQTVAKGKELEKEEKQKEIVERQKAQRDAYLAEQAQLKQTAKALGVPSGTTTDVTGKQVGIAALPAPATKYEAPVQEDPLINPLGNFSTKVMSPQEVAIINKRRKDIGKPRIGREFSIEDLADVFTPEEAKDKKGVLNRLIAERTGYQDGDTFSPKILEVQARNRGIDTGTQGFKDFLKRTTGVDNLLGMAEPQRLAVKQALDKVPVGSDFRILESGSNARNYTESQYQDTVSGLAKEFKEVGNVANGRESVLKQIEKYSGLLKEEDQQRLLDRALKEGLVESRNETRNVNGVPTNIQTFKPTTETEGLPGGMDIRKETFKQSEGPEGYQIRRGAQELDIADTAEEATQKAILAQDLNEKTITQLRQDIANSETAMLRRAAKLEEMKALGQGKTSAFFIAQGDAMARDEKAKALIAKKQQQIESFTAPVSVNPFGNKALTSDKFTFYEQGKPVARFDSEEKADEFGISRLNDETLQQIIDSAPTQKQTGKVKRYADLAQKELNDRQSIEEERGIAVTTTKGLKGATERLEALGIYTKETHDKLAQLRLSLLPALKRYGLENVGLRIVNSIQDGRADGQWVQQIMTIAMDSKDPMGTLKHESIHALKELGAFTKQEWQVLENKAKSDWIQKYLKDVKSAEGVSLYDRYKAMGLNQNDMMEEAIAEAFKHFKVGNLQPGMIGNIWMRLNRMFEALRNAFNKLGFQTTDDIFTSIEEGKKQPTKEAVSDETKLSIKPKGDYEVVRKAQPRGRTTDQVSYELRRISDGRLIQEFDKRKDAQQMLDVYTLPQEEVFAKYPELKPKYEQKIEEKYALNPEIRKIGENLVGAPPNAKTEKDRVELVKRMTNLLEHPYSMYDKSKNWYERSGDTIAEIAHGDEKLMERIVRLTALYSQANSLGGNITAVIKSMHQLAKGDITARAGRFPEATAKVIPEILAAKEFNTDLAGVDNKLMNFYHNLHDGTFKTDTFEDSSTIDRWMMRLFGYPHIEDEGEGGSASVSATQYKYAKDLIRKIADANEEKTGDKLLPRQIQAVLWTYIKNLTGAEKAKEEGKEFTPTSLDFSDYVIRATANITWESRPSTSIDLIQGIHDAPRKDQEAFNRAVRSIFETKDGTNKIFELLNEGVLYSSQNSIGAYENKIAPNVVTRVVLGKDDKSHLTEVANQTAAIIGYVAKQDAVPWYRADPTASGKMASKGYKVTPNTEITQDFEDKLFKHLDEAMPGVGFTRIDNSFDFINFRNEDGKPTFMPDKNYLADLQEALQTFSSDVTFGIEPFKAESNYIFNDWKENPNGEGYLKEFSARQLTDIQPTIDGWSKAYQALADEFGKEYGWSKGTTAQGEVGKLSLRDTKYAVALNGIAPETFLVPNEHLNDSGNLAQIPFNASIPKNPIRLPVGTHSNVDDTGYGANHILDRMLKDPSRKPKDSAQDLLESVAVHLMDLGKKFNRIYKVEGKYVLYDSLSNDLMFVKPKADHYEIATMYNDPNANRRYGNPVWSGRNIQPAENQAFQTKARGIAVIAENGRVVQKAVPTTVKKRRVITPEMVEQEAPQGKMSLRAPDTKEFKQWFGDSKIVNEDGSPKVYYHGTARDITEFKPQQANAIFLTDNPEFAEMFSSKSKDYMAREMFNSLPLKTQLKIANKAYKYIKNSSMSEMHKIDFKRAIDNKDFSRVFMGGNYGAGLAIINETKPYLESNENIIPLFVKSVNPFDYQKQEHIEKILNTKTGKEIYEVPNIEYGSWSLIETPKVQKAIKEAGFDAFYVSENGIKNLAVYNSNQIKSFSNIAPTESPHISYSLRSQVDPRILGRVEATTTQRVTKGYAERIVDAMSPTAMTRFRQAFINKYESIERLTHAVAEEFGADRLMAETSALAAALQSDRAAGIAASSFRDGVPVFDKGYTYVSDLDGKVKGLIPILEPLSKYGDPTIYQLFQFYAGTRRGKRLDAEGREKTFTKDDIQDGEALAKQFPEFKQVFDDYQLYNQGLVKYMMDTGVISAEEAKIWTQNFDYIPFYRQLDGEKTAGPKVFSPIAGVAKPKKLKGSEAPLDDFMETIVRNARAAIEAGMKNEAARRVIRDVVEVGLGEQVQTGSTGTDIVTIKEGGETKYYRVDDPLLVESLKGLNLPQLPFMDFLSAPANLLRNFVTKDPGFILANLGRDSMQAWITSGTGMMPLVDSVKQFSKTLAGHSPEAYALAKAGLTGYDFAGDVKSTAAQVEKELRKRTGTRTAKEKALLPITAFWDMLEHGSHASDMATRAEVYKRTLERTGSEAEAFYQAMEVMNFSRKGNSAMIRILSAMIPFFNARVQGLDVLYRTGWGKAAMENKEQIQKAFIFRSSVLLGLSVMYWAAMSDDDEYKKLSKEERDNYWIIPAMEINGKPFRFPIPFELGVVFKVIPERILEYSFGTDTGKDLRESLMRNAMSTLSFNPIPQAILPVVENTVNHSFFTGEPIIGKGVEGLAPKFQYTAGTSEVAKKIGREIDYSPQKIDNFIRGYTGTMGTYAMMLMDAALTGEGDSVKAAKRMEQLPVIKRFFAGDSGTISAYYDLKEEVDTVVNTVNTLQRTGNTDDLKDYLTENKQLYALKGYIGALDNNMKQLNQASKMINSSKTMSADEKRVALDKIHEAQLKLTERVKILRKSRE
jgi:hypothetical protein